MPSVTLLERVLRRPDAKRHALKLVKLLRRRQEKLEKLCLQPSTPEQWTYHNQILSACLAAEETILVLYRRYHNQALDEEELNEK
ncbi:EscE/YscE/SsaE family type III secretion system needle protein co-chaperone [Providencia sp. Me31A]|uniref:EscE/YscE/SsaE family type III secretion system needle protein co-chaperone n=1 Tax=Providencia sp. Me31A TaxID=3392637 RepID=UPI003D296213